MVVYWYVASEWVKPESASHGLIVHRRLVLLLTPQPRHGLGVEQLEDASLAISPLDVPRAVITTLQHHQQKLPQILGALASSSLASSTAAAHTQWFTAAAATWSLLFCNISTMPCNHNISKCNAPLFLCYMQMANYKLFWLLMMMTTMSVICQNKNAAQNYGYKT